MLTRRRFTSAVIASCMTAVLLAGCGSTAISSSDSGPSAKALTVQDQWGRTVSVPATPKRVVVVEWEGLVVKSMGAFGVADRIVATDRPTTQQQFRKTIVPALTNAKDVGTAFSGLDIEQIAALKPDVVFLEAWANDDETRSMHQKIIDKLTAMNLPTIVLLSPSNYAQPSLRSAWEIIEITGKVFGKERQAAALVASVTRRIDEISARIPTSGTRPTAIVFATTNYVMGRKSIQSTLLTDVLRATNPVTEGTFVPVSEEKLLALDPHVLLVIGHEGYVSAEEIFAGKNVGLNWAALSNLRAIKEKRLAALGYDEWRATIETPVALMKMAKALYPPQFVDVDTDRYELDYYREVFGLDAEAAKRAVAGQHFRGKL